MENITHPNKPDTIPYALTPKELLEYIASYTPQMLPVRVTGKLIRKNGYFRLVDTENFEISVENVKDLSLVGSIVEVSGFLKIHNYQAGGLFPRVYAKEIKCLELSESDQIALQENYLETEIREICRKKTYLGFRSYLKKVVLNRINNETYRGPILTIGIIHGKRAQTHLDFERAFTQHASQIHDYVKFQRFETTLSSDEELSSTLEKAASRCDLLVIVRGGGDAEELSRIGGTQTLNTILELNKPVYLAIGHTLDKSTSLLNLVADDSFPTPSIAGSEIAEALLDTIFLSSFEKDKETLHRKTISLEHELKGLQEKYNQLKKRESIYVFAIIILILVFALLYLF